MCILKCQRYIFLSEYFVVRSVAVTAIGTYGFIHYIPPFDTPFVAAHRCVDVIPHTRLQFIGTDIVALVIARKPFGEEIVPYKAVAYNSHAVFFAEFDIGIGIIPEIAVFLGMDHAAFEHIFGNDAVEMMPYNGGSVLVNILCLVVVYSNRNLKFVAENCFQRSIRESRT